MQSTRSNRRLSKAAYVLAMIASIAFSGRMLLIRAFAQTPTSNNGNETPADLFGDMMPVKTVRPVYPKGAEFAGLQGRVTLSINIGRDGSVSDIRVLSGNPRFFKAAVRAVGQWRYRPNETDTRVTIVTIYFSRNRDYAAPPAVEPVKAVRPVYPPAAKVAGRIVTLLVTVEKDGSVSAVEPLAGDPQLAQAAVEAVRQWRYAPMERPTET